ncbi:cytochrome P450 [Ramaria rubella]|nr:cytochrome P450 [Ramaria rubella]
MLYSNAPPGVQYICEVFPKLALPLLCVCALHYFLPFTFTRLCLEILYLLVLPAILIIRGILQYLLDEYEIRKLGARRVPQVHTRWPGGIDAMRDIIKKMSKGSVSEAWDSYISAYGPTYNITTAEPDHLKTILSTNFDSYEKGWVFQSQMKSVLGTGVFNSNNEMWKFHRGMARPYFSRDRVTDFDLFNRHADVVITKLKERFNQGEAVDFQDIMSRFTMDTAALFLFGSSVHSLSAPLPYATTSSNIYKQLEHHSDNFSEAFISVQHRVAMRGMYEDAWPLFEFWKDETKENMKVIHAFIDPVLKAALDERRTGGDTFLDHLVKVTEDHVILRDQILNIMIAGRDTTMATLTFTVYCLSQHPDDLTKLRDEILTLIGPSRQPTMEDVKTCKYLRAVINETLRLYPPVPVNIRRSKRSTTWSSPDGGKPYYIPADIDILYSVWSLHRRIDLWGPDAQAFDPERFLDKRIQKYLVSNPFIFMPFNSGKLVWFAYNETSVMLIRLLQALNPITLASETQTKIWPKSHLTLYSQNGLWLRMKEPSVTAGSDVT